MIKRLVFIFFTILILSFTVKAQPGDSVSVADSNDNTADSASLAGFRFVANLDSLLVSFYMQMVQAGRDTTYGDSVVRVMDTPDSVIADRISKIPSVVDLAYNDKVQAFVNLYTKRTPGQVELLLGLSEYYFPMFEEILALYDVPLEFRYLPVIESALNPKAISWAGAGGMWQFMIATGKMYNLEINSYVDERLDPVASSHAAAKFLKALYNIYQDWNLVLAAYNCGPGTVNRAILRSNGARDYWKIYYKLPAETRGYVPAFIAATYAMKYHKEHGIVPVVVNMPLTDTVIVTEPLHFSQVSEVLQIPMEQLRDLNPQYKQDVIPATTKKYALRLPYQSASAFAMYEDSIYNYKDSVFFAQKNHEISQSSTSHYKPAPPRGDMDKLIYTVKSGDNLGYISRWYNVNVNDLKHWNQIRRNLIHAGQKLVVYKAKNVAQNYKDIDDLTFDQKQARIGAPAETTSSPKQNTTDSSSGEYVYYTVKRGDTFWTIAQKYPGISDQDIMMLNGISAGRSLQIGQKLKIKKKGE